VALEAIRGELTLAELAAKHGIHHTMVAAWKRQAVEGMAGTFSGASDEVKAVSEAGVEKLHAKIGQLVVERDFRPEPPVDERGPEAIDARACSPSVADRPPRPASLDQPVVMILHAGAGKCGNAGADAGDRRGVPGDALVWQPADGSASAQYWCRGGPSARPAADEQDGLGAIYQRPRTSDPHPQHRIYPYLLRNLGIERPDQVWCADGTYIPMRRGFLYLGAIMDWSTRKVLAWRLSNTMDASFCVEALEEAMARYGRPDIFNTDQGSQFTSQAFTSVLRKAEIRISMDGRGRWMDNVFIERLWRSLKYECVYLHAFKTGSELRAGLTRWITYYNHHRPHSALGGRTPDEAYGRTGRSDHGGHAPHHLMTRLAA